MKVSWFDVQWWNLLIVHCSILCLVLFGKRSSMGSMGSSHMLWRLSWKGLERVSVVIASCRWRMRRWLRVCSTWPTFMLFRSWWEEWSPLCPGYTNSCRVCPAFWLVLRNFRVWLGSWLMTLAKFPIFGATVCSEGLLWSWLGWTFKDRSCCADG